MTTRASYCVDCQKLTSEGDVFCCEKARAGWNSRAEKRAKEDRDRESRRHADMARELERAGYTVIAPG